MEKLGTPIGSYAPDFELPGIDDRVHHLSDYRRQWRAIGVIFMCNNCPYVFSYIDRLRQIQAQFHHKSFTLVAINANDANRYPEESFQNMKQFAIERNLNFPYVWDSTQDVARSFGAEKTPEAFLIDKEGILCYSGQIDDSAHEPEAVRVRYLQNAIAALLAGKEVSPNSTKAIGTPIKWRN
jgi:peroxiredoxin